MKTATLMSGLAVFGVLVVVPALAAEDDIGYISGGGPFGAGEMAGVP